MTLSPRQHPLSACPLPRALPYHSWWPCCHMLRLTSFLYSGTEPISLWQGKGHKRCNQPFPSCNYAPQTHHQHTQPRDATIPYSWIPGSCQQAWREGTWYCALEGRAEPLRAWREGYPQACICGLTHSEHSPSAQGRPQSSGAEQEAFSVGGRQIQATQEPRALERDKGKGEVDMWPVSCILEKFKTFS